MNIGGLRNQAFDIIGNITFPTDLPTERADLFATIGRVITAAWTIGAIVAVAFVIYGGYSIMLATGDPQKLKKGQDTLAYAFVGLVIVIVSAVLMRYVASLLGVDGWIFNLNLPFI